jgi:hypothetical protein
VAKRLVAVVAALPVDDVGNSGAGGAGGDGIAIITCWGKGYFLTI